MKISKALRGFIDDAKKTDSYWFDAAKLEFALGLEAQRRLAGMSYKAVAQKIGTSAAYITKIFRGDSNVTIESMVKLARATGGRLEVRIVDETAVAHWNLESIQASDILRTFTGASQTVVPGPEADATAANDQRFAFAA